MSKYFRLSINLLLAGMLLYGVPAKLAAEGEHARRVGAELLVLSGDLAKYSELNTSEKHKAGLRDRILGAFTGLGLLLRFADEEQSRSAVSDPIAGLRNHFLKGDVEIAIGEIQRLLQRYPFWGTGILPATETSSRLETGRKIHAALCAGCHDTGFSDTQRPARDLFAQISQEPLDLFAARMVIGVRGDRLTGLDNPLTDEEIASLMVYYRSGRI